MVPATERQRYAPGARFDQPARHKKMLHQFRAAIVTVFRIAFAITFHDTLVFLLQIERFQKFAGGQHAEGPFVERIESFHQSARIHIATKIVKPSQQRLAVRQTVERDAVEDHVGVARAVGLERGMRNAKKTGLAGVGPFHVTHLRRQANKRRHCFVHRPLKFRDDRPQRRPTTRRLI